MPVRPTWHRALFLHTGRKVCYDFGDDAFLFYFEICVNGFMPQGVSERARVMAPKEIERRKKKKLAGPAAAGAAPN